MKIKISIINDFNHKEYHKKWLLDHKERCAIYRRKQSMKKYTCEVCNKELKVIHKTLHEKSVKHKLLAELLVLKQQ